MRRWITIGIPATITAILVIAGVLWYPAFTYSNVKPACSESLKILQNAKINWMRENKKSLKDTPRWEELKPYLVGYAAYRNDWKDGLPVCPKGGKYTLGPVEQFPKCSVGGREHRVPELTFPPPYHP